MTGMYGESRTIVDTQSVMYASDANRVSADAMPIKAFLCAAAMYCEEGQINRQYLRLHSPLYTTHPGHASGPTESSGLCATLPPPAPAGPGASPVCDMERAGWMHVSKLLHGQTAGTLGQRMAMANAPVAGTSRKASW